MQPSSRPTLVRNACSRRVPYQSITKSRARARTSSTSVHGHETTNAAAAAQHPSDLELALFLSHTVREREKKKYYASPVEREKILLKSNTKQLCARGCIPTSLYYTWVASMVVWIVYYNRRRYMGSERTDKATLETLLLGQVG